MKNRLQNALGGLHANAQLKQDTLAFLTEKASRQHRTRPAFRLAYALSAFVLVLALGFGGVTAYAQPVSYLSIDVNPSLELSLNRLDRVVGVTGINPDGQRIAQSLNLNNLTYEAALEALLSDEDFSRYLTTENALSITVISDREQELLSGIEAFEAAAQTSIHCYEADEACREESQGSGMSFGKYRAYLDLAAVDETATQEECSHLSIQQMQKRQQHCQHSAETQPEAAESSPEQSEDSCENETEAQETEHEQGQHGAGHHGNNHE